MRRYSNIGARIDQFRYSDKSTTVCRFAAHTPPEAADLPPAAPELRARRPAPTLQPPRSVPSIAPRRPVCCPDLIHQLRVPLPVFTACLRIPVPELRVRCSDPTHPPRESLPIPAATLAYLLGCLYVPARSFVHRFSTIALYLFYKSIK